ncbi:MAG: hypothetical protein ACQEQV_07075 [Fibrobacterota bacterium]
MKQVNAVLLVVLAVWTGYGADKCFPSPVNPAGKPAEDVTQYMSIIFDDNAYSGLNGTIYEPDSGEIPWDGFGRVGGETINDWEKSLNPLNIEEGDMGVSWGMNLGVPVTFNMITGLYVNMFSNGAEQGMAWKNYESDFGYYEPRSEDGVDHNTIAISWGREQEILVDGGSIQPNFVKNATQKMISAGHEIGNHTIDHMESNSPLPLSKGNDPYNGNVDGESTIEGFSAWGGDGFDYYKNDTMPWGEVINEAEHFGQADGASAQYMGWTVYAGKYISREAWRGAIELGHSVLAEQGGVSSSDITGFRAPRLEVNSGMFYGLADAEYTYDCGLEEGYEYHRDGSNFLWPYTVDNGAMNSWTQYNVGEPRAIDSMPADAGLWEIPVNVVVVPEEIRPEVWANHAQVLRGEGDAPSSSDSSHWVQKSGKITGFDFNMWIIWGMTKDNWLKTMKYTTTQRLEGNRAPFHFGMHTDYHTPIYDNATLLTSFNLDAYGLCIVNGWNEWDDRTASTEEWVNWSQGEGAEFVTGRELIEKMRDLVNEAPQPYDATAGESIEFSFIKNGSLNSSATEESFTGSFDGSVTVDAPSNGEYPWASFMAHDISVDKLNYISLDYRSNSALAVILTLEDAPSRQVILNNVNTAGMVQSGMIPLWAFDYDQYYEGELDYSPIDPQKITAVEIKPLAAENKHDGSYSERTEPVKIDFAVDNITFYGSLSQYDSPIIQSMDKSCSAASVQSLTARALTLRSGIPGEFRLTVMGVNGRTILSRDRISLQEGTNRIALDNAAQGVYFISLEGLDNSTSLVTKMLLK